MESIYFRKHVKTIEEAKNALVDLYTSILLFLAKAQKYFSQNSISKQAIFLTETGIWKRLIEYLLQGGL